MKAGRQIEAACPHCGHLQAESAAAISTNCRSCGQYFKLGRSGKAALAKAGQSAAKATREVACLQCGAPNLVSVTALSTQCIRCLHYLELGHKVIRGVQTGKLFAYDDVVFDTGCSYRGMEATGHRLEVRGKVFSKLRATSEIVTVAGGQLSGELIAPLVRVEKGGRVKVQTIECRQLLVEGEFEISGAMKVDECILKSGATFSGKLDDPTIKLHVAEGAQVKMRSIACAALTIEGTVTLDDSLRVTALEIRPGGALYAPQIQTRRLEIAPGGICQGRIEAEEPEILTDPLAEPNPEPDDSPKEQMQSAEPGVGSSIA